MLDPLQTAIAYLDPGHLEDADSICDTVLRSRPDDLARAASARQAHAPALEYLARAKNPEMSHLHVESAVAYRGSGAYSAAVEAARRAVGLRPDVPNGYQTLAQLRFQGANYLQVLGRVRLWLKPENYLETGVEAGASLVLVRYPRVAVDVDPKPRLVTSPNTIAEILPSTSDDYLAGGDPRRDIESDGADLAFIDGQQLFEQALRDCIDTDRVAGAKTVVLIHDCLVLDTLTAQRERKTRFWIGDIWKVVLMLREFRLDLNVFTIATPPSGLGVVTGLDCRSTILADNFDGIVSKYEALLLEPDQNQRHEQAAMVPNQW